MTAPDLCKYAIAIQCGPFACVAHDNEGEPESRAAKIEERKAQIEREIRRGLRAWPTCNITGLPVRLDWLGEISDASYVRYENGAVVPVVGASKYRPVWWCEMCGGKHASDPVGAGKPPEHDPIEPAVLSRWFARLCGTCLPSNESAPDPVANARISRFMADTMPSAHDGKTLLPAPEIVDSEALSRWINEAGPNPTLRVSGKVTAGGGGVAINLTPPDIAPLNIPVQDFFPLGTPFPHALTEEDIERIKSTYMRAVMTGEFKPNVVLDCKASDAKKRNPIGHAQELPGPTLDVTLGPIPAGPEVPIGWSVLNLSESSEYWAVRKCDICGFANGHKIGCPEGTETKANIQAKRNALADKIARELRGSIAVPIGTPLDLVEIDNIHSEVHNGMGGKGRQTITFEIYYPC